MEERHGNSSTIRSNDASRAKNRSNQKSVKSVQLMSGGVHDGNIFFGKDLFLA